MLKLAQAEHAGPSWFVQVNEALRVIDAFWAERDSDGRRRINVECHDLGLEASTTIDGRAHGLILRHAVDEALMAELHDGVIANERIISAASYAGAVYYLNNTELTCKEVNHRIDVLRRMLRSRLVQEGVLQ